MGIGYAQAVSAGQKENRWRGFQEKKQEGDEEKKKLEQQLEEEEMKEDDVHFDDDFPLYKNIINQ